jgi:hypothetical protein
MGPLDIGLTGYRTHVDITHLRKKWSIGDRRDDSLTHRRDDSSEIEWFHWIQDSWNSGLTGDIRGPLEIGPTGEINFHLR